MSKSVGLERHWHGRPTAGRPLRKGVVVMQYMLAVYGDERAAEGAPREQMTEIVNAYMAYTKALQDAKVLVGPFAETKEQLGGYYLIDVPDLDAALVWAKRCPAARYGTVEVRPIWVM